MDNGKINVMFMTHADKKGGAEQSLIHLINYLDTSRFRIFLLCPDNAAYLPEIRTEYDHFPLRLNSIKKRLGLGYLATVLRIKTFARKNRVHIIHANGWRAPWYAAPLKFLTDCKLIWHHRDHTHLRTFNELLPRAFDRVICISQFVAASIQGSNKTVIYNGIDSKSSPEEKRRGFMEDDTLVIGMFGRIVDWKRYHLVIDAVNKLAESKLYNWKLLIVGDTSVDGSNAYLNSLVQKVIEYGLEHHVIFYGYSSQPLEVMKECDLTINFSHNEPFGRVIIESLLVRTPVIVADSGGAPEILQQTGGGWIVRDGDVQALYAAIRSVYEGALSYSELSHEGYTGVMRAFDMEAIARQVEQTYHLLLAGNSDMETAGITDEHSIPSN